MRIYSHQQIVSLTARMMLVFLGMLAVSGCPKGPALPPPLPPGTVSEELTTEEVSDVIAARAESFQSLRGDGKVRINTWDEQYTFTEIFVLQKPEFFRLETLGAFSQPAVFLTSDGNSLMLYTKKHNTFYQGVPSQENLFKLSGINLSVEDTILVLSGNLPQLPLMSLEWGMSLPGIQQHYLERISLASDTIQRVWLDTQLLTISYFEESRLTDGKMTLRVQFENYRAAEGGYPVPARVLIDRPLDKTRFEVKYKGFEVNQPIEQSLFQFTPPESAKAHYLDDITNEDLERLAPYEEFRTEAKD